MTSKQITTYNWPANSALYHCIKGLIFLRGYPESLAFKVHDLYRDNSRNLPIDNEERLKTILFDNIKKRYNNRITIHNLNYPRLSSEFMPKFKIENFKLIKSEDNQDETREDSGSFKVYPRTFICGKCGHYRNFRWDERLKTECERPGCKGKYEQLSVLKFCETCGKVEEFYYRCENRERHPEGSNESMTLRMKIRDEPVTWRFVCDVCGTERDPLNMWCNHKLPDGTVISTKDKTKVKIMTLREGGVFNPVVINTVDLPTTDSIAMQDIEYLLLAVSLGKFEDLKSEIKTQNILKLINNLKSDYNDQDRKNLFLSSIKNIKPGLSGNDLEAMWKSHNRIDKIETAIGDVKRTFDLEKIDLESFNNFNALKGLFSDKKDIISYKEFIDSNPEDKEVKITNYNNVREKFKLKNISYIPKLKLISSCIGMINGINRFYEKDFTPHFEPIWRNHNKDELVAYSYPYHTEGILFEFDSTKIIEWLNRNNPDIDVASPDEFLLKMEKGSKEYVAVYTLLHTLSHLLIKKSSLHAGLDEQSCSEMIFPCNSAILLFSTSNINIGGFGFVFENYLYELFTEADYELRRCIYDPLCIKDKGACFSCMYLPEHVCHNMNQNIDRGVLLGNIRDYKYRFW